MSLFSDIEHQPSGRAIILSVKPKYANLILSGTKKIELRRTWPSNDIGAMVIYSSSPIKRLVGIAHIERVEECNFHRLWELSENYGGGVTQEELKNYLADKSNGYGIIISTFRTARIPFDPKILYSDFKPPQSFSYLNQISYQQIANAMFP